MKRRIGICYLALLLFICTTGTSWAAEQQPVDVRLQPTASKGKQEQASTVIDLPDWAVIPGEGNEPAEEAPRAGSGPAWERPKAGAAPASPLPNAGVIPPELVPKVGAVSGGHQPAAGVPSFGPVPAAGGTPSALAPESGGAPDSGTPTAGGAPIGKTPDAGASPDLYLPNPNGFAQLVGQWVHAWKDHNVDVSDFWRKAGRGIAMGAVGAVALTIVVAGVMALVGTTITGSLLLPLLGAGLAVGTIFSLGYSFAAGDSFQPWKGALWAAIGAGVGMAAVYAGAGFVLQSGLQLLRSGISRFAAAPLGTLRSILANKWTMWSIGTNLVWNSYVYRDEQGSLPRTARDWGRIVLGSLISALVFDRFSRFVSVQKLNQLRKNVLQSIIGVSDTAVSNLVLPKREQTASGYLAGIAANMTVKPAVFGRQLDRMRRKRQIGTTLEELQLLGVRPRTAAAGKKKNKPKTTNKMLDRLYRLSAADASKVLGYLRQQQGLISKNQLKLLQKNQAKYNRFLFREKGIDLAGKYAERKLDSGIGWGLERAGINNQLTAQQGHAGKGDSTR
ncbi:hypothetical protein [Brevibacillus marinus]|uniref:hypothetical protein n=1 Tax=Brevibacillus marinus TaxID=2496837 RepID=UPI000F82FFBF|nr:hypothetical protein [Brevibacillus marinus]